MNSSVIKEIRSYWIVQLFIVLVLSGYFMVIGFGFYNVYLITQNGTDVNDSVEINLWIISERPGYQLNYSSSRIISSNISLLDFLNDTLGNDNWTGKYYGVYGWFITGFFNVTEEDGWFWVYYYRPLSDTTWTLGQVGVSHFILDRNYDIKFEFSHN
ncbi:MAG: hypothetical protein ACTSW1_10785 [Candidatus Hodarchaeales archaeon]